MAQANPFDQFDGQAQPVPVQSLRPIIGAVAPEEQARKEREEQRDVTRLDVTLDERDRGIAKDQFDRVSTYRKEFLTEPTVRQFREVENATKQIVELAKRDSEDPGPGDIALIISFMKALDPGSVVRETEFATAENAGGVPERIRNAYNKYVQGGKLTPEIKREFASTATAFYNSRLPGYNTFANDYRGLISSEGADPDAQGIRLAEPIEFGEAANPPTRPAGEGEEFLTDKDKELQTKLSEAFAAGATRDELNAIAAPYGQNINNVTQEELDRVRAAGGSISVVPTGRDIPDPRDQMGFFEGALETVTGSERGTAETEALPDWASMPELNSLSVDSFQAALGTMMTDPAESVAILRAQFPDIRVRQDEKGNYILRSGADGKEYAIKPGMAFSDVPRIGGALAAFTPAGRATTLTGAAVAGAGTQAAIEGTQAATGGEFNTAEVVAAGVGNVAGAGLGKGISAAKSLLPTKAPAQAPRPRVIPDAAEVIATGKAAGVDVMTSNVRPPRTWLGAWLRSTGEKLPFFGTAGAVAKQADQRAAMIERLADQYKQTPASIDDVTADFIKKRGGEIAKYAQLKRDVFSETAGAPPPVAQESLDALDMAIGRYGRQETFGGLTQKLQGWRNDLASAENINDVEAIRKSIGDTFQDESMKSSSAALREVVDGPKGLYAALKTDMGDYIRAQAGDKGFRKWAVANGRLSDFAGDLEKTTLERVLKTGDATPEEARLLLFSNKPSDVRAMFRNLSPQGKERARAVVVQKLIDDAGGATAISELSPARFRGALEKSMERIGVAFPKAEADRFTGMLRLLQVTQNAERASVITPTGQTTLPFLGAGAGAAMFGDLFTGGVAAGLSMAAFRGYESKAMRYLLVSLSKTKPGSKAESNVLANIGKVAAKASGPAAATVSVTNTEQQPATKIEVR